MHASLNEPLSMDDVCRLAEGRPPDSLVTGAERRRMTRRLRRLEQQQGVEVLFGGGRGSRLWTTRAALRLASPALLQHDASLVTALSQQLAEVESRLERIEAQLIELRGYCTASANDVTALKRRR